MLMRGDVPRRRALEGPMPYELTLEVAVLPVSGWARRKFPDGVNIREQTRVKALKV